MKLKRLMIKAAVTVFIGALGLSICATLTYTKPASFKVDAKAAFAFDQKTGKIFYAKNANKLLALASVTKILSSYIILEWIHQKKLNWTDKIPIKEYPYELTLNTDLSNVPLEKGTSYSVRELFDSGMIASASSSVIALAEKIAGSEVKFVKLMKDHLKKWGIKNAVLINSTGLSNSFIPEKYRMPGSKEDQENMMSAHDIAVVAYHLIKDYPEILEVSKKTSEKFGTGTYSEFEMKNWNGMLPEMNWEYGGVDGLKTGTSELAGQCFVGTCLKKNQRIVTVVLHANGDDTNSGARYTETAELMDFVYDNWKQEKIIFKGNTLAQAKKSPVKDGKKDNVPLVIDESVTTWVRDDMNKDKLQVAWSKDKKKTFTAPVKKDEKAGKVKIQLKDDKLGYLLPDQQNNSYQMVTNDNVKRQFFLKVWGNHILEWINGKLK
ncbi:MAG: D-alanyl-D-alanine carboxypeptidase [Streptococcaceae bacterium]|jgi:D-alanyl-D-alanine carboxypeptidase (penicillin-binding protein 5/6)|nr:D-alanyl-D-alanine carboxypeptidase [Streptococcaceae bacterium]